MIAGVEAVVTAQSQHDQHDCNPGFMNDVMFISKQRKEGIAN